MRRALSLLAAIALLIGIAFEASAEPVPFRAELSIVLGGLGTVTSLDVAAGLSDVSGQTFTLAAFEITAFGTLAIPNSTFFDGLVVQVENTTPATFSPGGGPDGGFGGTLPLAGTASFIGTGGSVLPILDPIGSGVDASSTGVVGATTVTLTVTGTPWTTAMVTASGFDATMNLTVMRQGFNVLMPDGQRDFQLVTPFRIIRRESGGPASRILPGVAVLRVTLPEPPFAWLAAPALALVAALAQRRRARRRTAARAA